MGEGGGPLLRLAGAVLGGEFAGLLDFLRGSLLCGLMVLCVAAGCVWRQSEGLLSD